MWWMLQSFGFGGRISVLDGGLRSWTATGGELASLTDEQMKSGVTSAQGKSVNPATTVPVRLREGAFVGKEAVLSAISDSSIALVDSLTTSSFEGTQKSRYGRPGHIVSALSMPYTSVVDEDVSGCFFDKKDITEAFAAAGLPLDSSPPKILAY